MSTASSRKLTHDFNFGRVYCQWVVFTATANKILNLNHTFLKVCPTSILLYYITSIYLEMLKAERDGRVCGNLRQMNLFLWYLCCNKIIPSTNGIFKKESSEADAVPLENQSFMGGWGAVVSPSRNIQSFNSYTASHYSQFSSSCDSYFYFHFTLILHLSTQMSALCHCQRFAKH